MAEFVYALSNGDEGTPVYVSKDFAKSAGLKIVDGPDWKPTRATKKAASKRAAKKTTAKRAARPTTTQRRHVRLEA